MGHRETFGVVGAEVGSRAVGRTVKGVFVFQAHGTLVAGAL